jgi:uncharacterized protein (TIGR00730 family)
MPESATTSSAKRRRAAAGNRAQVASPTYRLAAHDPEFLQGAGQQGVRLMLEFAKADEGLRQFGVHSTIVVFGSARVEEDGPEPHRRWYADARRFAAMASEQGGARTRNGQRRHNVIATGGGPGIMEAANRGAADVGAPSIGFNITLPREQGPNPHSTPALTFQFQSFAMRKMHLALRANALVVFPGGVGTLDELFEILTLLQTEKAPQIPVVLYDEAFWRRLLDFRLMVELGLMSAADLDLFEFAESPEAIWSRLVDRGVTSRQREARWAERREDELS